MNSRKVKDRLIRYLLTGMASFSVLVLVGIFGMLIVNGVKAFEAVAPGNFLFSFNWNPAAFGKSSFGMLSMVASTFLVTAGAMIIAIPLGIGTAAYLSEVAHTRVRNILKPLIEILAGVPSVAIGFIGIVLLGPLISRVFGLDFGLNALNGSILLAIMALPTIISVAEESIRTVPQNYKEASYALGANKWSTLVRVTIPAAFSGIIAAVMLGMGRAIGETMTVLMATGNATALPEGFFSPVRTLTATIAIELGEVPFGTSHFYTLFALGAILFLISLFINVAAEALASRFRHRR